MITVTQLAKRAINRGGAKNPFLKPSSGVFQLRRGFWPFSRKKKQIDEKRDKISDFDESDFKDMISLGFLVNQVKEQNAEKEPLLPEKSGIYFPEGQDEKITVCIEMDEVFLYSFYPDQYEGYLNQPTRDEDFHIDLEEYNTFLNIYLRDNYQEFFEYLKTETEAVLFSTGTQIYVNKVMDLIDPDYEIFKQRITQEGCNYVEYDDEEFREYVKDLDWMGRNLKRTVLVDTKPFSFWCNPDNSIPARPYNGNQLDDNELLNLIDILENLKTKEDVRFELIDSYGLRDALKEVKLL